MIWYRHWLELRSTAVGLIAAAAVLGPFYLRRELLDPGPYRGNGYEANLLRPLIDSLEPLQLTALERHLEFLWFAILFGSLFLAADGLRIFTNQFGRTGLVTTTAQYTLSLPVSRHRVVLTRIAAGYLLGAVALTLALAANVVVLKLFDRGVPFVPMLLATGFATLVILFWICILISMLVIAGSGWGVALTLIGMLFGSPVAMWGMSAAAGGTLGWPLLLLFVVVLLVAVYVSVAIVAGEEV